MQKTYLACLLAVPSLLAAQVNEAAPRFEKDILPIFTTYCFTCHGKSSPKLGLDVRTAASTMRGSHNGPVIVKGSPEKSLLFEKVSTRAMPPAVFGQKLPEAHIETIRRWILAGAPTDQPTAGASKEFQEQAQRFEKQILPLFTARCVQCHGQSNPAAKLDLRSLPGLLKGSANGPVVIEGFSEQSVLVRLLASRAMPPKGAGEPFSETDIHSLRQWIDKGHFADTVESVNEADRPFTKAEAPDITDKDRQFWSFRKPVAMVPPKVKDSHRVRNPIDAFILAKLEAKGLTFSPDAPALTLMRRAYMDLTGMPPTLEDIRTFQQDTKPGAYERLLDRLLASPYYGERWGRHWLDVAGYVDTTGKDFDATKPELADGMWRYRDYVIESINADKPWDRFLTEQIAGDEMVDWRAAKKYTPQIVEHLVATGYLRNVLDITDEDITNLPVERYEALFKLVETVSSSTLGLTVSCARCHSHKFDPISQRDYYSFLALFTSGYNPTKWLQPKNHYLYSVSKADEEEIKKHNAEIDRPVGELKKQLEAIRKPYEQRLLDQKLQALPENIRDETRIALATPKEKRDDVQKFLFEKFGATLKISQQDVQKALNQTDQANAARLQEQIATLEGYRRKLEKIQALWDVGPPPSIRLLQRGNAESPGPKVDPGYLTVLSATENWRAIPAAEVRGKTSGIRLAFAQWLTSRDQPLSARVIVNRMWQHHFGVGIVATPDNFGKTGTAPTHPELLDWLAVNFMDNGWRAKRLHKLLLTSTAYRQSARQTANEQLAKARAVDPENHLLWRMNVRRLEAEALRDSLISVSGNLDRTMGGPPVMLQLRPDGLQTIPDKDPSGQGRRSIYLIARRTYPLNFLGVFDYPAIDTGCPRRVPWATPLQSLTLMNDQFMLDTAAQMAARVVQLAGQDAPLEKRTEIAWLMAFSRLPSNEERVIAAQHIKKQEQLQMNANVVPAEAAPRAFADLCHMLLSANEFLYVD